MSKKLRIALVLCSSVGAILIVTYLLRGHTVSVLQPAGPIAHAQLNLLLFTCALALLVVVPVFGMTFYIVWKYRVTNTKSKAKYTPDWDHNHTAEVIWWLIPLAIISVLAVVAWRSSHSLDPYKAIESDKKPLTIQVIALEWKWLFVYPDQNIASVNDLRFPADTPVNFEITADAPMNSFWIPQLGGQIYAMAGMQTKLHLLADKPGSYNGASANLSGDGFADMKFVARATTQADFDAWVASAHKKPNVLSMDAYYKLAKPSKNNKSTLYAASDTGLFTTVMMNYMMPPHEPAPTNQSHAENR